MYTNNEVENQPTTEDANATVAQNEEQHNPDDISLSEETEIPDEETVEPDEDSESEDEPDLTPGVKKRIAKLKAKADREKAELRAEFDSKLMQLQQNIARQQPNHSDAIAQAQYQQMYGNPYQQNGYQQHYVDPNQQQPPTFEQFKQWQAQAEQEKRKSAEQAEIEMGLNAVLQNANARRYQDAEFAQLADTHGNLFNQQMLYALKGLKNPSSFIKHVLKNEKDRAALRQLQTKNPFEQVAALSQWATKYESLQNRTQPVAKPKPITQPKGGGSVHARVKVGLDPNNASTWSKDNIKAFMRG